MKNIILFIAILVGFTAMAQRPTPKLVKETTQYQYLGTAAKGDTIIRGASKTYDYYTPTLFNTVQSQVLVDTITGKPKVKLYLYQSWDYSNWVYADSATTITGGLAGRTTKTTVFAPYVRLIVKGVDSVQKTLVVKVLTNLKVE